MKMFDSDSVLVGNNSAIDFVNTQIAQRGEVVDLLQTGDDLSNWAAVAELCLENIPSKKDLSTAKALRAALAELFIAKIDNCEIPKRALTILNRHLAEHAQHEVLQVSEKGEFMLVDDKNASSHSTLLATLANEGAQLLASPNSSFIKRCGNPECVLIFLDSSRSRKRRWCSMDTCGNRAKVAKHYRGQAG